MIQRVMASAAVVAVLFAVAVPAQAGLTYYPDPVYKKLAPDDHSPMDDILNMAKQGDARAQFMIADLYSKGKGGMPKDLAEAKRWFEESAMHGYDQSFIRLAAIAKREKKPAEAWQWYTLALDSFSRGDARADYVEAARQKVIDDDKLTSDDISAAKKAMHAWEDARDKHLDDEEKEKEKQPTPTTPITEGKSNG